MKKIKTFKLFESNSPIIHGEEELELFYDKSTYFPGEKAIVGAYMITSRSEKSIEVLNIKEYCSDSGVFQDNATPYTISIHKTILPLSQILIIGDVEGKEGFSYIKIPFWLYKTKSDDLTIRKCKGRKQDGLKRIDLRDKGLMDKVLMKKFGDVDVQNYLKVSDTDDRTQFLVGTWAKRANITS